MLTVPSATLAAGLGPVGIEKTVEQVDGVYMATAIGIDGTEVSGQKVAVVVQLDTPSGSPKHCGLEITDAVRASVARWLDTIDQRHGANRSLDVVAVLEYRSCPSTVDIIRRSIEPVWPSGLTVCSLAEV